MSKVYPARAGTPLKTELKAAERWAGETVDMDERMPQGPNPDFFPPREYAQPVLQNMEKRGLARLMHMRTPFSQLEAATRPKKQRKANTGFSGGISIGASQPYLPEFDSPDRDQFPWHAEHLRLYLDMFDKLDPVFGSGLDVIRDLLTTELIVGGVSDPHIKQMYEECIEESQLATKLPWALRENLASGEAVIVNTYNSNKGYWTKIDMLDPSRVEVDYIPHLPMDPILTFIPDAKSRDLLMRDHPTVHKLRERMPQDILDAYLDGTPMDLDDSTVTFLARRIKPWHTRGTSIGTRLWRLWMLEDGVFNTTIQTVRRAGAPIRVARYGDQATREFLHPDVEAHLQEQLQNAELDPLSWLIVPNHVQFDRIGVNDSIMSIERFQDPIERMKLIALGIPRSVILGEATLASAAQGMTMLLKRVSGLWSYGLTEYVYPKFFMPLAKINDWIKPTQAELSHGVRTRRSARELEEDRRYIIPDIRRKTPLSAQIDKDLLDALAVVKGQLGYEPPKQAVAEAVGRDWADDVVTSYQEAVQGAKIQERYARENLQFAQAEAEGGGGGGMGMGGGLPPDLGGGEDMGAPIDIPGAPPPAGSPQDLGATPVPEGLPPGAEASGGPDKPSPVGSWGSYEIRDIERVFKGDAPEEPVWRQMLDQSPTFVKAHRERDFRGMLEAAEDWLIDQEGVPARDVTRLRRHLENKREAGALPTRTARRHSEEPTSEVERRLLSLIPGDPGDSTLYTGCGPLRGSG